MTKLEALKELLDQIEQSLFDEKNGRPARYNKFMDMAEMVWPVPSDLPALVWRTYRGSLDTAKALHEDALGFDWAVSNFSLGWYVEIEKNGPLEREEGYCDCNPARAWLIAILKALIAKEQEA